MKHNRGLSYIEIIISMSLIFIMLLPISNAVYVSLRSYTYSKHNYFANIVAENLINVFDNYDVNEVSKYASGSDLREVITIDDFDKYFYTNQFNFSVTIKDLQNDNEIWFTHGASHIEASVSVSNLSHEIYKPESEFDTVVTFDKSFAVKKGIIAEITEPNACEILSGEKCMLDVKNCSSPINIILPDETKVLHVYHSCDKNLITVTKSTDAIVYFSPNEHKTFAIVADVFDKQNKHLKRLVNFHN